MHSANQTIGKIRQGRRAGLLSAAALPLLAGLVAVGGLSQPAGADSLYWDTNGPSAGSADVGSAPGTWDSTTPNWSADSTGGSATQLWTPGDIAIFSAGDNATGGYTVTLDDAQSAGGLIFDEGVATIKGTGSLDFGANAFTLQTNRTGNSGYVQVPIIGSGDMTITNTSGGDATINLDGPMSGFTGNIIVGPGTDTSNLTKLQMDWAPGDPTKTITLNSFSELSNNNQVTLADGTTTPNEFTIANPINLVGSDAWLACAAGPSPTEKIVTYSGNITGTGNLWLGIGRGGGNGTVVLAGNNSYAGDTYVVMGNGTGMVQLASDSALPTTTHLIFGPQDGGTGRVGPLDLNGHSITVAGLESRTTNANVNIVNSSMTPVTMTLNQDIDTSFNGVIGSPNNTGIAPFSNRDPYQGVATLQTNIALVKNGAGTLTLTGASPTTADTTINGGAIVLGKTFTDLGTPAYTLQSNTIHVNSGATLATVAANGATFAGTSGAIEANSGSLIAPGGLGGIGGLMANDLTVNDGAKLNFDLGTLSDFDSVLLNNQLTLDSGTHVVDIAGTPTVGTYNLMTMLGGRTWDGIHDFSLGTTPGGGFNYFLTDDGTYLKLAIVGPGLQWDADSGGAPITEGSGTWADGSTMFADLSQTPATQGTWSNAANIDVTFGSDANQPGGTVTLGSDIRTGGRLLFGPIFPSLNYVISDGGTGFTLTTVGGIAATSGATIDATTILANDQTWTVASGQTLTLSKNLSGGTFTLTKDNPGTLALNGAGGTLGKLNVIGGLVALGATDAIGTAPVTLDNGGLEFAVSNANFTNPITLGNNGGALVVDSGADSTVPTNITGTGPLVKGGPGVLTLSGNNTFTDLALKGGLVAFTTESNLGTGNIAQSSGGLRALADVTLNKSIDITGTGELTNAFQFDTNGHTVTVAGSIGTSTGNGEITKLGSGTLVLGAANSLPRGILYIAPGSPSDNTVELGNADALGNRNAIVVDSDATLKVDVDTTGIQLIRGTSVLHKTGPGTLVLTGPGGAANGGSSIIVDQGAVRMNSRDVLGGNNNASHAQEDITLNSGTELLVAFNGDRLGGSLTLNNATITRPADAATTSFSDAFFDNYTSTVDFGSTMTINGNVLIRNQAITQPGATAGAGTISFAIPTTITTGSTLTVENDNPGGFDDGDTVAFRGAPNVTTFPNDAFTLQPGSTFVTVGPGQVRFGRTASAGKTIVGQGTPGSEAVMKLSSNTYMNDRGPLTTFVVAGSGNSGLRIEAPMNATYTDRSVDTDSSHHDGTTGLFGLNTNTTGSNSYDSIHSAYTVMSANRWNQLSTGAPGATLGGTLTLAANDPAGATGLIDNGPAAQVPIRLALDNTPTSGNLVYQIDGTANSAQFGNFAGLDIRRSNSGAGTVTAQLVGAAKVHDLTVNDGTQLDVNDKALAVDYTSGGASPIGTWDGSKYTGLSGLIQSGRNGGTWTGPGIITSQAQAQTKLTGLGIAEASEVLGLSGTATATWNGQTVDGDTVLVKYTYGGDANLDGKINIDDYGLIDSHVGQSGTAFGWHNGDFNYDGKINIDDYGIIDGNIGAQGDPIPNSALVLTSASAAGGVSALGGVSAVPEPASLALLGLSAAGLLRRRRRHD